MKVRILEGASEFNGGCMSFSDRKLYLSVGFSGEKPVNNNNKNYIKKLKLIMEIKINSLCPHSLAGGGVSVPENILDAWGLYFATISKDTKNEPSDIVAVIIKECSIDRLVSQNQDTIYQSYQNSFVGISGKTNERQYMDINWPQAFYFNNNLSDISPISYNGTHGIDKITNADSVKSCSILYIQNQKNDIQYRIEIGQISEEYAIPVHYSDFLQFNNFIASKKGQIITVNPDA